MKLKITALTEKGSNAIDRIISEKRTMHERFIERQLSSKKIISDNPKILEIEVIQTAVQERLTFLKKIPGGLVQLKNAFYQQGNDIMKQYGCKKEDYTLEVE